MSSPLTVLTFPSRSDSAEPGERGARSAPTLELTSRIRDFIAVHLEDPDLSATSIARAHHISVRYLYVLLEAERIRLGEHIRRLRVDRAAERLRGEDDREATIGDIAVQTGFADHAHFGRVFRAVKGMTPSEWRRIAG